MEIFTWIEGTLGPISILINNAEVWYPDSLLGNQKPQFPTNSMSIIFSRR